MPLVGPVIQLPLGDFLLYLIIPFLNKALSLRATRGTINELNAIFAKKNKQCT
jgi:hypothetical protein